MGGSFREDMAHRRGRFRVVQFTERADQKNIEYIPRSTRCRGTGAGVQLLGDLIGKPQT